MGEEGEIKNGEGGEEKGGEEPEAEGRGGDIEALFGRLDWYDEEESEL